MTTALTLGELFAGMGGFSLGFGRAGFRPQWHVEIDRSAQAVLRKHHPQTALYRDVRDVSGATLAPVDAITFGSPCQDLSVAGRRAGLAGERSGLFFEATRIIGEMREATNGRYPTVAVWENVPGALSSNGGRDFGAALNALADCGAVDVAWRVIDAQHWTPQRRRRVFVVALFPPEADGRVGGGRAAEILVIAQGVRRGVAAGVAPGQSVAGTLGGGAGSRGWAADTDRMTYAPDVAYALADGTGTRTGSGRDAQDTLIVEALPVLEAAARQSVTVGRSSAGLGAAGDPMYTLQASHEHGVALSVRTAQTGANGHGVAEDAAHTLDGASGQAVLQGVQVRRLLPVECLRLQGFPDGYCEGLNLSDAAIYRLTGNAVAVPVVQWIGERLVQALTEQPE